MQHLNQQRGMATLLLVLLVGVSIMLITAGFARSLNSKKEATVAAHAQTNAQIMGWSGVSAFREYLGNVGRQNITNVQTLNGQSLVLRSDPNSKEIVAKNIKVTGCTTVGAACVVSADLVSDNKVSQAATTIQVTYDLTLHEGAATLPEKSVLSFTGDTTMIGTVIEAEVPNTTAVLNVDGTTRIQGGITTNNVSEIIINSKGDFYLDCSAVRCTKAKITIYSEGLVHITDHGFTPELNIGDIKANKEVYLQTNVKAGHIESGENVYLATGSRAQSITAHHGVTLSDRSRATDITSNRDVTMLSNSTANSVRAKGHIDISNSTVESDVRAYEYVDLDTGALVKGSVYAKGHKFVPASVDVGVRLSLSRINGHVYANKNLRILDIDFRQDIGKNVYLTGVVRSSYVWPVDVDRAIQNHIGGTLFKEKNNIPELNFTIQGLDPQTLNRQILEQMAFETKVDVRVYKQDANYIFTRNNGMERVYLNHLKNAATDATYMFENNQQLIVHSNGTKQLVNDQGFSIGRYTMNGQNYIGAICETIVMEGTLSKYPKCTSEIVGYLPRLSVGTTADFDNDYDYTGLTNDWHVRTTSASSTLENASFAPGILYFEGNVNVSGHGNLNSDSSTNTFTNTFLAEGDLNVIAVSPKIYSPYNVIRDGHVSTICDRELKTIQGHRGSSTTPVTLSNKYLIPVNLCRDAQTFKYDMNKDADGNRAHVQIDNTPVKKLDLGYVALMGNQVVRIGTCSQIYGDVLSRGTIEGSAACGATRNPNKIVGNVSSQGEAPYTSVKQHNTFGLNSKLVVPNPAYTNARDTTGTPGTGLSIQNVALTWSKYQ